MKTLSQYSWLFCMCLLIIVSGVTAASLEPARDVLGRTSNFFDTDPIEKVHNITAPTINDPGRDHILIDFEGYYHNEFIGTVFGSVDTTFGPTWVSSIDADTGFGSGNFANEPSPDTIAMGLYPSSHSPVNFSEGVMAVSFFYSAAPDALPLVVEAWDDANGTGIHLDTAIGNLIGHSSFGADCEGDPTGQYCKWGVLTVYSADTNIRSITFPGAWSNWFIIDDMRVYLNYENQLPATDTAGLIIMLLIISVGLYVSGKR